MKVSIACRVLLLFCWMSWTCKSTAQVSDDFSDGDFSNGVYWSGDTGDFVVNTARLRLNSTGSDSAFLLTQLPSPSDTMEWVFRLRLDFAPSSQNYCRYYLLSSQPSLEVPLDGYFIQIGESGAADAFRLCRQQGWQVAELLRGSDSVFAAASDAVFRIILYPGGQWNVYVDQGANGTFLFEGSYVDTINQSYQYFGWKCVHTSTNATAFHLDDIYTGAYRRDTLPPSIQTINLVDDSTLLIRWAEPVDLQSALLPSRYSVNGLYPPVAVMQDTFDIQLFRLKFTGLPADSGIFLLNLSGVCDLNGNCLAATLSYVFFRSHVVAPGDVAISEVMADPTDAPALPPFEYVEIANRSPYVILTKGWHLSDATSEVDFPQDTLFPGDYHAYTQAGNEDFFHQQGILNVKGISGFPALNNDGDRLSIRDSNRILLDILEYDWGMYVDPLRDDKGWSLERTDIAFPCQNRANWRASRHPSGGTPGESNSVSVTFIDNVPPRAIDAFPIDSMHVIVSFSEELDTAMAMDVNQYVFDKGIGVPVGVMKEGPGAFLLLLGQPLLKGELYAVTLGNALSDCPGNRLGYNMKLGTGLPDQPLKNDIVLNEILTDPIQDGCDFVEIYNNGTTPCDLSEIILAKADPSDGVPDDHSPFSELPRLIMPGQYAVATPEPESLKATYKVGEERMLIENPFASFNNDDAIIVLLTSSLVELERLHYKSDNHFPLLDNTEGISLERISPFRPADDISNWHSASENRGFASPCDKNSQYIDNVSKDQWLKVVPELFSPDNDGNNDVLGITARLPANGYVANIVIYDEVGSLVRNIARQELLGGEGWWLWDGQDESGNIVQPGLYMIILNFFHANGDVRRLKHPCVVARKNN